MNKRIFTTLIFLVCLLFGQNSYSQDQMPTEHEVKAAFLYNFTNFIAWPDSSFANKDEPFVIGICGDNPFDGALSEIVKGEKVNGTHPIVVRQANSTGALRKCQMIFYSSSDKNERERLLGVAKGRSILTVGEADDFAEAGGMIGFVNDNGRVKFELNIVAAENADLRVDSRLQRVAKKIVR